MGLVGLGRVIGSQKTARRPFSRGGLKGFGSANPVPPAPLPPSPLLDKIEDWETPVEGARAIREAALGVAVCRMGRLISGFTVAVGGLPEEVVADLLDDDLKGLNEDDDPLELVVVATGTGVTTTASTGLVASDDTTVAVDEAALVDVAAGCDDGDVELVTAVVVDDDDGLVMVVVVGLVIVVALLLFIAVHIVWGLAEAGGGKGDDAAGDVTVDAFGSKLPVV